MAKSAAVGKGFSLAAMPTAGGYAIATACSNLSGVLTSRSSERV
ncbi:hypothetical protein [Nostoc sp. C110]